MPAERERAGEAAAGQRARSGGTWAIEERSLGAQGAGGAHERREDVEASRVCSSLTTPHLGV